MSSLQESSPGAHGRGRTAAHASKPLESIGAAAIQDWRLPTWPEYLRYLGRVGLTMMPLMAADVLGYVVALAGAYSLVDVAQVTGLPIPTSILPLLVALVLLVHWCVGLYPGIGLSREVEMSLTVQACIICHAGLIVATLGFFTAAPWLWIASLVFSLLTVPLLRLAARELCSRFKWWGLPAIIFGRAAHALAVCQAMVANPRQGLRPMAIIDELHDDMPDEEVQWILYSPTLADAPAIIQSRNIWWGVLVYEAELDAVVWQLDRIGDFVPHWVLTSGWGSSFERRARGRHDLGGIPGLRFDQRLLLPVSRLIKRLMDVSLIVLSLPLLLPLLAVIAILVRFSSPGPILLHFRRIGRWGQSFEQWKFRSMVPNADKVLENYLAQDPEARAEWQATVKLKKDPRVTGIGRILRKTSLDELPQLWNVLIGNMSIIGPRPISPTEVEKYRYTYSLYQWTLPGITGLWQISGRNNIPYSERLEYARIYIRNWSLWLDIKILLKTIKVVLGCEGAY